MVGGDVRRHDPIWPVTGLQFVLLSIIAPALGGGNETFPLILLYVLNYVRQGRSHSACRANEKPARAERRGRACVRSGRAQSSG